MTPAVKSPYLNSVGMYFENGLNFLRVSLISTSSRPLFQDLITDMKAFATVMSMKSIEALHVKELSNCQSGRENGIPFVLSFKSSSLTALETNLMLILYS